MRICLVQLAILVALVGVAEGKETDAARHASIAQGISEYRQENFEEAATLLEAVVREAPESGVAAYYLGLAYKQTGELTKAKEMLITAAYATPPVLDAFLELGELAYTRGEYDAAMSWVRQAAQLGVKSGPTAFLAGLIAAKQGDEDLALAAFAKAKKESPELGQAVDMQRAMLLAGNRRYSEAQEALRAVITIDATSDLATYARDYELLLRRAAEIHRDWHVKVGLGGLYDDNVVAKPDGENILDITNKSDLGFVGSFQLDYTPLLPKKWLFSGHYALQSTSYDTIHTHSTLQQALTLVPGLETKRGTLTVPVSYSHLFLAEKNYLGQTTVRPTLSMLLGDGHLVQLSSGYSRRELHQAPLSADENRDANLFTVGANYATSLRQFPAVCSLRYEFTYDRAVGLNWQNRGHRAAGSLLLPLDNGLTFNLGLDTLFQNYNNVNSTFKVRRDDVLVNASGGLSWNFNDGYSLTAQYTYSNATSNITYYDYQRNQVNIGLEFSY